METSTPPARARQSRKSIGGVYVIGTECDTFSKVGFSKDPLERVAQLQTACPHQLRIVQVFRGSLTVEAMAHKHLQRFSCGGEWFRIRPQKAALILLETMNIEPLSDEKARTGIYGIRCGSAKKPRWLDREIKGWANALTRRKQLQRELPKWKIKGITIIRTGGV